MATDESARADGSMWPTGQGADHVSSPAHAMTAPGSPPALPVLPSREDPDPAEVQPARYDGRRLARGEPGGHADGHVIDDVSGRREPWP